MYSLDFRFPSKADGLMIAATRWGTPATAKAVVVIAHGMAEHKARYQRFAAALNDAHYLIYALDHRGHGETIPVGDEPGGFGEGGWLGLVDDIVTLMGIAREENDGLPLILFGHSMGSFAAQQIAISSSDKMDALVLSGSAAQDKLAEAQLADDSISNPLEAMSGSDARTPFDWLSRDEREVDKYMDDPLCGFALAGEAMMSMGEPAFASATPEAAGRIRKDLPVLSMAGTEDPVNGNIVFLEVLEERWKGAGLERFDTQYYKGARHELLNETNRDKVTEAVIGWMNSVVS